MTWPSGDVDTTGMDSGSDTPPRATFLSWAQKFNQLINHFTAFMQGLMTSATAADARATLDVPTRAGGNASGTWGISISGNAATATAAASATNATNASNATGPASSASAAGIVELATDAEARNGADASRAVTPANLTATVLGMGQTLTDVTGSRLLNTTYVNGGKTTVVNIRVVTTSGSGSGNYIGVTTTGGQQFDGSASGAAGAGWVLSVLAVIPPNSPYSANINNATLQSWKEML